MPKKENESALIHLIIYKKTHVHQELVLPKASVSIFSSEVVFFFHLDDFHTKTSFHVGPCHAVFISIT